MKRIKFICGNSFTRKTVEHFIKKNFSESEIEFYSSPLLSSILFHRPPEYYDCIIIGDNIKTSGTGIKKQEDISPILLRDYIIVKLRYFPKICLFTNSSDYHTTALNEEIFSKDFEKEELPYINNLEDDAFKKLYDFIKSI